MTPYTQERLKDLTDDNLLTKVDDLIKEIGTTNFVNNNQSELMFILYNRIYPENPEHTRSCGSCREKVYRKLNDYLKTNKQD
jgi:hypothetical protein